MFFGNIASGNGGAIEFYSDRDFEVTSCTFSDNTATNGNGGGLWFHSGGDAFIKNSIFWDNDGSSTDEIHVSFGTLPVTYSDVELNSGTYTGTGNINSNPLFVDANAGNYRLDCNSPCTDEGDSTDFPQDANNVNELNGTSEPTPARDLEDRIHSDEIDMGAYEASAASNCTADIVENCVVDVDDLLAVINSWGACSAPCPADIAPLDSDEICANPNGTVNTDDLLLVINNWGPCPGSGCVDTTGLTLQDAEDCMDAASLEYEAFSPEWDDFVNKCVDGLREAGLIP